MLTGSSFTLAPTPQAASPAAAPAPAKHDFSFGDLLDIVNPLQHIPVVGTLYRWATGDKIGTPEKIAGDTLYGGPMGALSSVADTLFEQATGKNFGDTVLSLFTGHHDAKPAAVADGAPDDEDFGHRVLAFFTDHHQDSAAAVASSKPAQVATADSADVKALSRSLAYRGVNQDLAARALYAYRRSAMATAH